MQETGREKGGPRVAEEVGEATWAATSARQREGGAREDRRGSYLRGEGGENRRVAGEAICGGRWGDRKRERRSEVSGRGRGSYLKGSNKRKGCRVEALVSRQFRKQRLARWAAGRRPDPCFAAMVFWCCDTVLGPGLTAGKSKGWSSIVSRHFRKQRLARWAAGRGPAPSFAAMVFWCCDTVLGPELTAGKSKGWSSSF